MFLGAKMSIANQRKMPLIGKTGEFTGYGKGCAR
jgi:hypothetical protein